MKKYKKTIIVAVILWIPLAVVLFINSTEKRLYMKILLSIISGPGLAFFAGLIALAGSAAITGSLYLIKNLEAFTVKEEDALNKAFSLSFNGLYGIAFAVLYYFTITNHHLFYRIYGGW